MFDCNNIRKIAYYVNASEIKSNPSEPEAISLTSGNDKNRMSYYTDNGADLDETAGKISSGGLIFPHLKNGETINPKDFLAIAEGTDPATGNALVKRTKNQNTNMGSDLTFSMPKDLSILIANAELAGTEFNGRPLADVLRELAEQAKDETLELVKEHIITRTGKGGKNKEIPADVMFVSFHHTTSREGDPQEHFHVIVPNICLRQDGKYGSIDNALIMKNQNLFGNMYDTALIDKLKKIGIQAINQEKGFRIEGITEELKQNFSKRRNSILDVAETMGFDTTTDRNMAQMASYNTRQSKKALPTKADLRDRWRQEIADLGTSPEAIIQDVMTSAFEKLNTPEEEKEKLELDEMARDSFLSDLRRRAVESTIEEIMETEAVFSKTSLMKKASEKIKGLGSVEECIISINDVINDKLKLRGYTRKDRGMKLSRPIFEDIQADDEAMYSNQKFIDIEKNLISNALRRKNERPAEEPKQADVSTSGLTPARKPFCRKETMEAVLAEKIAQGMTQEQADAVRHALCPDGVAIVEGFAGAGKSWMFGVISDIWKIEHPTGKVHGIAPSHKAKSVLQGDAKIADDDANAVSGFINRALNEEHPEHKILSAEDLILTDEAGMVGSEDMELLLEIAEKSGTKLILAGDTKQLQPVSPGSPMKLLAGIIGTQQIRTVRRQRADWMKKASENFGTMKGDEALSSYFSNGKIEFINGHQESIDALVQAWKADVAKVDADPSLKEAELKNQGSARLAVCSTNKDVQALNTALRQGYREAGRLTGEDITVKAYTRGSKPELVDLKLASGDRIIFSDSIKISENQSVNNSDIGTITGITIQNGKPIISFKMDKLDSDGKPVEFTKPYEELIGKKKKKDGSAYEHPLLQHAYAVTNHASQGSTVENCFVLNSIGMQSEACYVAMTRHKGDVRMFVDKSRIIKNIARYNEENNTLAIGKDKMEISKEAGDEIEEDIGTDLENEECLAYIQKEVLFSQEKTNNFDFLNPEEKREFLSNNSDNEEPKLKADDIDADFNEKDDAKISDIVTDEVSFEDMNSFIEEQIDEPEFKPKFRKKDKKGEITMTAEFENKKQETATKTSFGFQKKPIGFTRKPAVAVDFQARRKAQGDYLKKHLDLAQLASQSGFQVKETEDKKGRFWIAKSGSRELLIWNNASGWGFKERGMSSDAIAFIQSIKGCRAGEAREEGLRFIGKDEDFFPGKAEISSDSIISDDFKDKRIQKNDDKTPEEKKIEKELIQSAFLAMPNLPFGNNLLEERGISEAIIGKFRPDIKTDGYKNIVFPHRDSEGKISSYSKKGRRLHELDKRSYSHVASGGKKSLVTLGNTENPTSIYIAENAIDALSYLEMKGSTERPLILATDGTITDEAFKSLKSFSDRFPDTEIKILSDNDEQQILKIKEDNKLTLQLGSIPSEKWIETIKEAMANSKNISVENPPFNFKDWNDYLQNKPKENLYEKLISKAKIFMGKLNAYENIRGMIAYKEIELQKIKDDAKLSLQDMPEYTPVSMFKFGKEYEDKEKEINTYLDKRLSEKKIYVHVGDEYREITHEDIDEKNLNNLISRNSIMYLNSVPKSAINHDESHLDSIANFIRDNEFEAVKKVSDKVNDMKPVEVPSNPVSQDSTDEQEQNAFESLLEARLKAHSGYEYARKQNAEMQESFKRGVSMTQTKTDRMKQNHEDMMEIRNQVRDELIQQIQRENNHDETYEEALKR